MKYKIGLLQYPILFHKSKAAWKNNIEKWYFLNRKQKSKLIVFPEYGSLDLISLNVDESKNDLKKQLLDIQDRHDFFLSSFIEFSKKFSVYTVAPSFPIKIGRKIFNRAYFISPFGKFNYQDKIHMTKFENDWGISPSETALKIFDTDLGKIGIQICFDIEFPWPSAILAKKGVKLILSPSCTETLAGLNRVQIGAKARALENQIYVGVSQTVGNANWSLAVDINTGRSAMFVPCDFSFPNNGVVKMGTLNKSQLVSTEIDLSKIRGVRNRGQVENFYLNSEYPWLTPSKNIPLLKMVKL